MWNQFTRATRPIFTKHCYHYHLNKLFIHNKSAITVTCNNNTNQRLIRSNNRQRLIHILPRKFYSSNDSPVASKSTHEKITQHGDGKGKVTIDEQLIDKLFDEMDQYIAQINQFNQSKVKKSQYKIFALTVITMVVGVFAGAYAAHVGAWFLDKIGLFIFQEDDDDD